MNALNALIVADTQIRRDASGRYCLNDIHEAAVAAGHNYKRCQVEHFMRQVSTSELIDLLRTESGELNPRSGELKSKSAELNPGAGQLNPESAQLEPVITGSGRYGGTYAVKELVYAYAMWISAAFHLHVIRAYDALVTQQPADSPKLATGHDHRADQMVGAGRIFSAAMRTARALKVPPARAVRSALACTLRHTGIDWAGADGLNVSDIVTESAILAANTAQSSTLRFHDALVADVLDGLEAIPGRSKDWYSHYCRWCADAGVAPATIAIFVHELRLYRSVRNDRKRWRDGAEIVGPHAFLMIGDATCPANEPETDWLGRCAAKVRSGIAPSLEPGASLH